MSDYTSLIDGLPDLTVGPQQPTKQPDYMGLIDALPAIKPATAQDRAQAFASGVNKGVLSNIAGLPVDTALNAWDLMKAGAGYLGSKVGLPPSNLPDLTDRSGVFGSSDYIANAIRDAGGSKMIDPNNPNDTASQILSSGGQGVAGSMLGGGAGAVRNMIAGGTSQALSQGAGQAGASPSMQVLASLVPAAGPAARQMIADRPIPQPTQRDNAIAAAQDAGYVFPPSQIQQDGAGFINSALEKVSGKVATAQAAGIKNQNVTQNLVKQDFGIPADQPLNIETLEQIRKDSGAPYQAIKQLPALAPSDSMPDQVAAIFAPYNARVAQFPNSAKNPQIEGLKTDMQNIATGSAIDPGTVIDQVKQLRDDGFANSRSPQPDTRSMGKMQLASANALEGMIDSNLQATGQTQLLNDYRNARTTIAKTYTAQNAIDPVTGNINAVKLAQVLAKGKPLTDGMLSVAQAATVAPSSMKAPSGAAGVSKLEGAGAIGSVLAAIAAHNPLYAIGALYPMLGPAARGGMLSGPYQNTMARPSFGPGAMSQLATSVLPQDQMGLLGALAAH